MVRSTDRPAMTIAVDLGRKATKQTTNKQTIVYLLLATKKHDHTCFEKRLCIPD